MLDGGRDPLEIDVDNSDERALVTLSGELDASTASFLYDRLSDLEEFKRNSAQDLRATAARYPDDPELTELVGELLAGSEEFTELWDSHDVAAAPTFRKTFQHPLVGPVTVNCDVLDISDRDQRVVIYTATPGSPSESALRLLSVIGTQRMDISP